MMHYVHLIVSLVCNACNVYLKDNGVYPVIKLNVLFFFALVTDHQASQFEQFWGRGRFRGHCWVLSVGTRGPGRGLAGTEPVLDRLWQERHRGVPAQWDQSPGPGAAGE